MRREKIQRGYTLLVLLIVLLSASMFLGFGAAGTIHVSAGAEIDIGRHEELLQSRQSLLSYAALYPFLYGPRGAGAGHLPCPDTDGLTHTFALQWSALAGPNPPCGSGLVANGSLPSHININHKRYLVHSKNRSPITYQVSSRVINNPVNRVVNPSLIDAKQVLDADLAMLTEMSVPGALSHSLNSKTTITAAMMLLAIRPAVSAWFIERVNELQMQDCLWASALQKHMGKGSLAVGEVNSDELSTERCRQIEAYLDDCYPEGFGLVPTHEKSGAVTRYLFEPDRQDEEAGQNNMEIIVALLVVDDIPTEPDCLGELVDKATVESVPAKRHWFYRNEWPKWLSFSLDETCINFKGGQCRLRFVIKDAILNLSKPLIISWAEGA